MVDRPLEAGGRLLLENLPSGPAVLTIESYPIGRKPALARALIELAPGTTDRARLVRLPDPPRFAVAVTLLLPPGLAGCSFMEAESRSVGGTEELRVQASLSRRGDDPPGLSALETLPTIGDWVFIVEGHRFPFRLDSGGAELRFELPAPALLRLRFEGAEARRMILRWRQGEARGLGHHDEERDLMPANPRPGPIEIEIEIETDDGIQFESFEAPAGYLLPEALVVDLEAGTKAQFAFVLERRR